jgi:4-hydroxy-3-methylbut-2-en-1-yl diphosphate synthase IspG/GcpE
MLPLSYQLNYVREAGMGNIKKLSPVHRQILNEYFETPTLTKTALAARHGLSRVTISNLFRSRVGKTYLARKENEMAQEALIAKRKAMQLAPEAVENLAADVRLNPTNITERKLRNQTSMYILDMIEQEAQRAGPLPAGISVGNMQINIDTASSPELYRVFQNALEAPVDTPE